MAREEVQAIARQMVALADPRLIKILYKAEEPVGFLFAYPDVSAALQRTGGRLWPFGWLRLYRELRTTRWVNVNGAGIAEGHRGLGGTALLFTEMYRSVRDGGFEHADLVQIGRENLPMLPRTARIWSGLLQGPQDVRARALDPSGAPRPHRAHNVPSPFVIARSAECSSAATWNSQDQAR